MLNSLKDLYIDQLKDLHSAETQLLQALPKVEAAASHDELKAAVREHLEETRNHVERLDRILSDLGVSPKGKTCEAMRGLIKEGEEVIKMPGDPAVKDAALIASAQRIEHYEIAGYGCVRTYANLLDQSDHKDILNATLDEESAADEKLNKIATGGMFSSGINKETVRA